LQLKLGLWIDLTNTNRFYSREEIEASGAIYTKLSCKGHGEAPSAEQIDSFVEVCRNFTEGNSSDYIGVHCTHGFNRSGFLVCCFLIKEYDFSVFAALSLFAKCRPPGIYKQSYINALWELYNDDHDDPLLRPPPLAPPLPDWCFEGECSSDLPSTSWNEGIVKRSYESSEDVGTGSVMLKGASFNKRRRGELVKAHPTFMNGIHGIEVVMDRIELLALQRKVQNMCSWSR